MQSEFYSNIYLRIMQPSPTGIEGGDAPTWYTIFSLILQRPRPQFSAFCRAC